MKLTNNNGLPEPLVKAIQFDSYKASGDISVSGLIDAPQIRVLKKQHSSEIEMDVSEYLFALMGTMCHSILERSHISDIRQRSFLMVVDTLNEKAKLYTGDNKEKLLKLSKDLFSLIELFFPETQGRYIYEMQMHYEYNGMMLSGTMDLFDKQEKCLIDYKVCSVYAYLYPESRKKWANQTNCYAFLLRNQGYEVKNIDIVTIFRDWSASRKLTNKDYPSQQFMTIPIQVRSQEEMKRYVEGRMDLHLDAEKGNIPDCDGHERWASSNEYSVKTKNVKRAVRKFDSEKNAQKFIDENNHKYEFGLTMFVKPGESKRCQNYCPVAAFCPQKEKEDKEHEELISQ